MKVGQLGAKKLLDRPPSKGLGREPAAVDVTVEVLVDAKLSVVELAEDLVGDMVISNVVVTDPPDNALLRRSCSARSIIVQTPRSKTAVRVSVTSDCADVIVVVDVGARVVTVVS